MSVCFSNSLPIGQYLNLLIVAAFSNNPFSGKTYSPVKYSSLPIFPDEKSEMSVVSLPKLY